MSFFDELKRRNVFRVGVAYGVVAWVLLQVVDLVLDNITAPEWIMHVFMLFVGIGFVAALIVAWAYEMTPEGIKREADVDRSQSVVADTGRKLDRIIIAFLVFAVILLLADRFLRPPGESGSSVARQVDSTETSAAASLPAKSIAVLPFADLSQAKDQEWFADGLAEEILNALAKTPDLQVSSRTSTFRYKGTTLDIPEIAAELGVAHILEGSVRSGGNRIRVTAQLIRASDGFHVWSENYDRDVADMIAIQEDLALSIARALETMDPSALAAMSNIGTRSVEAYEEYLRGLSSRARANADGNESRNYLQSYEHFENARRIDPNFTAAHYQSADFWRVQIAPSRTDSGLTDLKPLEALAEFNTRIDRAIETATNEIDVKGYQAHKALVEMRLRESINLFEEYLKARPNDELTLTALMDAASMASDRPVMLEIIAHWRERALTNVDSALGYANSAYRVIAPSEAADFLQQVVQRWPNNISLLYQFHRTMLWAGRFEEATQLAAQYNRLVPETNTILNARQACVDGRRDETEFLLASIDPNENDFRSERWHLLKMLGRDQEADDELRPFAQGGIPYQIADMLGYPQFDPGAYPSLMAILQRQGVNRPPVVEIPFKCPPPEGTSIAVLPFVNMSTDEENEFFSDGISEEILNVLASIPELKVAARTSAFAFKGTNTNITDIADELGVNHILEGSVRKVGNQVRVTAQLIQASDGFHLWSENYDRELTNIFAIQDEIAGSIADALKVTLELEAGDTGNLTGTSSIEAYEHYLQGMSLWHQRTAASLTTSIEEFEAAIRLDPDFAKAHAGLALTWSVYNGYTSFDAETARQNALLAANAALELDPQNVEAMASKAWVYGAELNYQESEELFKKAIHTQPSFASAHQWYASLLNSMGNPKAALAAYRKAWSLDPRSRIIGLNLAIILDTLGQRAEGVEVLNSVLAFAPDFPDAVELSMMLHMFEGRCDEAATEARRLAQLLNKQDPALETYQDICQSSDPEKRKQALHAIVSWPEHEFADPTNASLIYDYDVIAILIEYGEFDLLWRLVKSQLPGLSGFRTENGIKAQCDPRASEMLHKYNIPLPVDPVMCN
jgi:TolB-like protein/Tfp pilus assembly protein PilF